MGPSGYCHRKLFGYFSLLAFALAYYFRLPTYCRLLSTFSFPLSQYPENRTGCGYGDQPLPRQLTSQLTGLSVLLFRAFFASLLHCFHSASLCFAPLPSTSDLRTSDQALGLLVSSTCMPYDTSSYDLSTSSSLRGLTSLRCGNLLLQGGFTLRCLQRLSRPHFASQLCHWHDNCCTRGASIPVLSY